MGLTTVWIWLGVSLALGVLCGWRGAMAPNPRRGPRMLPWRMLMAIFALNAMLAAFILAQLSLGAEG